MCAQFSRLSLRVICQSLLYFVSGEQELTGQIYGEVLFRGGPRYYFIRAPSRSPIFKDHVIVFIRRKKKSYLSGMGYGIPIPSVIQVAIIRLGTLRGGPSQDYLLEMVKNNIIRYNIYFNLLYINC